MRKFVALVLASAVVVGAAHAQVFTLTDGNAVVDGDAGTGLLYNWFTDGVDHLFNQDYYFRVGATPEAPIWTVSAPTLTQIAPNIAHVRYANNVFAFDITYTLIGGGPGSGTSDIGEIVRITNLTNAPLAFSLFEYDDFDLNGTAGGDMAMVVNGSTIRQWEGLTTALVGSVPPFDRWEIDAWPNILAKLNDGNVDNLSNTTTPSGPGDLAFAMQWDRVIAPNGNFLMSKNKHIEVVPEPATLAALGLGLAALLRRRRK
ncbi:MAG TPA: PEP-CTERM sorting domain-containing protein [Fimbriimonadaceae bacterium]|nr:PEP-CTERM sorting domain-containing protein [Fimbriimonadaceae bacterium]